LGDGTFGRALECEDVEANRVVAVKVVRAVERYTHSAKIEANILNDIKIKGGCTQNLVDLEDVFTHESDTKIQNTCLVFEPLGKSLFDFIKDNNYQGFEIG
jgi:dual-specificity kinase